MPGRGFDAIGYRTEGDKVNILIGEAKVSSQKENPPHVVDVHEDSIYKSQKNHHDDIGIVLQRLTDYLRRLSSTKHFYVIAGVVINMKAGNVDKYDITYGCGLVRDSSCVNEAKDFGKMQSLAHEFEPGLVDFAIFHLLKKLLMKQSICFIKSQRNGTMNGMDYIQQILNDDDINMLLQKSNQTYHLQSICINNSNFTSSDIELSCRLAFYL